jgi:hypothetical protein
MRLKGIEMAIVNEACPSCGKSADIHVGQAIGFDSRLLWSHAIKCAFCGYTIESDDFGFPPEPYREAIRARDGSWGVFVDSSASLTAVAIVLKESLGMGRLAAIRAAKAALGLVWTGTQAEAEWLRRQLSRRAVVATCSRVAAGGKE